MFSCIVPSPLGPWVLESDGEALTGLRPGEAPSEAESCPCLEKAAAWLEGYFAGCPGEITFPLKAEGTPFQQEVWRMLLTIPWGRTLTYGELAKGLGRPGSARAVGGAVGKNPIGILIPCHRVVAKGGPGGYAWGLERKLWLLRHEGGSV